MLSLLVKLLFLPFLPIVWIFNLMRYKHQFQSKSSKPSDNELKWVDDLEMFSIIFEDKD
ncbi:hypothetical protein HMPREF1872_00534 [Amygdalobacter nucleatus]|uniref:Uncharacterized protein n=1 Tax=Amygdalobacter nucleatus TaxID=3029274 RepID=A0A133YFT8_9FIRM|nr:hypothetical protein HMPREF1872_00534 [Amygdalobacter nucleatus]